MDSPGRWPGPQPTEAPATLAGTVDTWSEFDAATQNAHEGDAVWVDNDLEVE